MHALFIQNSYPLDGGIHRQALPPHCLFVLLLAILRQADAHRIAAERYAQHSEADGFKPGAQLRHLDQNHHRGEEKHRIVQQDLGQGVVASFCLSL